MPKKCDTCKWNQVVRNQTAGYSPPKVELIGPQGKVISSNC